MALAFVNGIKCKVHVDKDLGDTWAVSVVPEAATVPVAPLVVKLQGVDKEKAMLGALKILQDAKKIDRYEP